MVDTMSRGILAFAHQLAAGAGQACGFTLARDHRWLDEHGRATDEGRILFEALVAQRETRTAFRFLV